MRLKSILSGLAKSQQEEILLKVYTELLGAPDGMTSEEMATELQLADMNSKWGFDCGLSYIVIDRSVAKIFDGENEYENNEIEVGRLLGECGELTRASRVQSTTITHRIAKNIIELANEKFVVPEGVELFDIRVWLD